jgi:Cdc6-like AAA superfamily ATPase
MSDHFDPDQEFRFTGETLSITQSVNEEEILDLALMALLYNSEYSIAQRIVINYVLMGLQKSGKETFDYESVMTKYQRLVADFTLANLAKSDFVSVEWDENGEVQYKLTEKGLNSVNKNS